MSELDPAAIFRQEASELLDQLEQTLLDLDATPGDRDLIDAAFRALHTVKGSGSMFGFTDVASFTHDFETAFDGLRKSGTAPSKRLIAVALAAKDHIRALIDDPGATDTVFGDAILDDLRELADISGAAGDAEPGEAAGPAPAKCEVTYHMRIRFAPDVMANGTNPLMLLDELRDLGSCIVTPDFGALPPLAEMDPALCYTAFDVELTTVHPRSAIDEVFMFVADEMELVVEEVGAAASAIAPVTAKAVETVPAADPTGPAQPIFPAASPAVAPAAKPEPAARGEERGTATVRVQAERLDRLMDRVGELVIAQARLSQLAASRRDPIVQGVAEEIERLAASLRDTAMGMRMVPIGSLFGRFRRLVHDLSRELDKPLDLITSGEETELDKTMIERLADPLVHIIRNAVDHGLEKADQRVASGKAPTGSLRLSARHVGAEVHVTIEDDGKGLDLVRIRAKGEEQGLIAAGAPASEAELIQLMFAPGFSTARELSALSGRGVGMDVVKRTIEGMRGTIDVSTRPGQGSRFTLRLPLTLAIIEGLLVRVADGRYIVPLTAVEECVELKRSDDERSTGRSFLNIRGDLVPFMRLRQCFGEPAGDEPHQKVVVVSSGEGRVGLVVDQILGNHQAVIKSLSRLHRDVGSFSGATILGDGQPALILDVAHLVHGAEVRSDRRTAGDREAA